MSPAPPLQPRGQLRDGKGLPRGAEQGGSEPGPAPRNPNVIPTSRPGHGVLRWCSSARGGTEIRDTAEKNPLDLCSRSRGGMAARFPGVQGPRPVLVPLWTAPPLRGLGALYPLRWLKWMDRNEGTTQRDEGRHRDVEVPRDW